MLLGIAIDTTFRDDRPFALGPVPLYEYAPDPESQVILAAVIIAAAFSTGALFHRVRNWGVEQLRPAHPARRSDGHLRPDAAAEHGLLRRQAGGVMLVLSNDVNRLERFLNDGMNSAFRLAVMVAGIAAILFVYNWQLVLVTLVVPLNRLLHLPIHQVHPTQVRRGALLRRTTQHQARKQPRWRPGDLAPSDRLVGPPANGSSKMHLSEATWMDADSVDTDLAILPVGSTEQHGPHAPLGTDALTADAVAKAGASAYDGEVVVAPTISVGVAEEHRHFAGTLWVSEDTFRANVRETVNSLAYHGWDRVVVVNGHGGNVDPLREVCGTVSRRDDAYAVPFTWFDAVDAPEMGHGGPEETSLVQHLAPDMIRDERLEAAADGGADGWGEYESSVNLAYDTIEFSENGTVGDPRDASAERGEALLDDSTDALVSVLEAVSGRDLS